MKKKLYTFTIPVTWSMTTDLTIEAESLEEACEKADSGPLPDDGEYMDDSWEINVDCLDFLNEDVMEIIKVDETPLKDLPLLMGTLETDKGKERFEQRLTEGA
jgi:hypothetical protein